MNCQPSACSAAVRGESGCRTCMVRLVSVCASLSDDELALLVVHGILHVLGHDHATDDEAVAMRAIERQMLEAHHWGGPAPAAFRQEQT